MLVKVDIQGLDKLLHKLQAGEAATKLIPAALYAQASEIFAETQFRVPVRTGVLRASGHVKPLDVSGGGASVEIAYGGAAAPYAIYVHERLDVSHDPPTGAKFLEIPVTKAAPQIAAKIAQTIEQSLGA